MLRALAVIIAVAAFFSCKKKGDGINPADKEKAAALQTMLQSNSFRLTAYYSESPIDYIDTDQVVKSETDLWGYVSEWLHDDAYVFQVGGNVSIEQNVKKIPSNGSGSITKKYDVKADTKGVGFNFVGHEYQYLQYRLVSFSDSTVKVSATWNNKTVISEYSVIP